MLIPIIINFLGEEAFADIELFNVYANLLFQVFGANICTAITKYKYDSINAEDYLDFSSNIYGFGILITFFSSTRQIKKKSSYFINLLTIGVFSEA